MNTKVKIAIVGTLLAALSVPAYAASDMADSGAKAKAKRGAPHQAQSAGPHGRGHGPMAGGSNRIMTFDTDGDGRVTQTEVDEFRNSRLLQFDTNGDGSLTLSEYQALWLAAMREKMVDRFQDLDADGDALVTAEEFKRPFANLVRHLDRNGDGVLTRPHQGEAEEEAEEEEDQNQP